MDGPKRTKGKLVAAATVSPRTDFIVTEKEQQSPRSVIQSFRNRSSPRRLFHLPEDSGESSNDDVFDEDDEESDVDAYPTENAFKSNLNTYNTENVSEEKEESTVGCVSSASNELKEDDDYVCSAENEFDDDEDYVNSDENEFEEDDNYVNLSENEFEEDDSRERQSASHSSDNDIIQDYSSVIQVVTSKAKWKLMGTKGPAALARALANVILTTEELQSASLTGKRDPRGKKRKVQESKLELIKETVFKQFSVPGIFQEATWRDVKLSLTQMLKYKSKKGKLVAAATVSPRTDFIVTEKEQQSPRSVIQSFRNRSSPRRLFHLPEDSGESSNDDVFDEDDEESDVDAYPTENAFKSNLNTYNTENVSEEKEESTVGCVSSASNELKEDDDYVCSAENEFDDDEDYVNSDENEFEEDDNYVNLSENEFEEDDSRERQSASHSSDNDIIQDYSSVIQVVTSKAKWKLMGTKGPAALARALANVILTTEELQSASLTGKRDPRGKKRKVQESKLELIKETVFKQFSVPGIFQEATWRDVKLSLTQMLKYKSKKGKLVAAATVSPRTDFIVTEKEQQSPRSVIQSFRNRSSPRRLFHLPEDSGESSNDDVFDEDDEESDVDAYPTENAFKSNLNTYNTENVSEEKEESTVGCVSSASNELKEDDDYVCSAENEFDDDEDYVNSDENEFEEDDNYVNLSENEFEEDDSRERQSASHSSDNDIIQDYSSVIQVVTSKAKWKLMGTKGPAALARALANVILTTEELQSASLTGKRDPRGKKRKVQESKLELIKETVFKQFSVPGIFQEATWRDVKLSLTQMLKYKSKKGNKKPEEPK